MPRIRGERRQELAQQGPAEAGAGCRAKSEGAKQLVIPQFRMTDWGTSRALNEHNLGSRVDGSTSSNLACPRSPSRLRRSSPCESSKRKRKVAGRFPRVTSLPEKELPRAGGSNRDRGLIM